MENIKNQLKTFSRVLYILTKIAYVASIVGVCVCASALVFIAFTGDPSGSFQIGGTTIHGPIDAGGDNIAEVCGLVSYLLAFFAFLIPIMRWTMKLFANMRDNYTPFTLENAALLQRVAVLMIVASIVPAVIGHTVGNACATTLSLSFSAEYGDGFSLVTVLLFFAMSMVFKYGCALQEQADTTL